MKSDPFKIIFEKITEEQELQTGEFGKEEQELVSESQEIAEMRRIILEINKSEQTSFTTT